MKTELEGQTKRFAAHVVKAVGAFPKTSEGQIIGRQLLKSGTSIGANYRQANRAESRLDFVHKIGIAEKETVETIYWLEICQECRIGSKETIVNLCKEAGELLAILITIARKAKNSK
jgi:four helix bundle protein